MQRLTVMAATAALLAGLATSCSDDEAGGSDRPPRATAAPSTSQVTDRPGRKLTVVDSEYGPVIADARGEAFYLFAKERSRRSECYDACAVAWPPVLTKGKPRAGAGVDPSLLGTTRRRNGKLQVTYRGHPLYYYVDDSPGTILCQDVSEFGGRWLVVKPNGSPVT